VITRRIDTHSHLLPGVDDGCSSVQESIQCAQKLVQAGYSDAFCTPHIWPNLPDNNALVIPQRVKELQNHLDAAGVNLRLHVGGELNLRPDYASARPEFILTYGLRNKFCIFDIWADQLPPFFPQAVRSLQSRGLTVIMAHPERLQAVQDNPSLFDYFSNDLNLLLQANLQCLSDPADAATRQLVERFLLERRYFCLGSDTHNVKSLQCRLDGLSRAIDLLGEEEINRLTIDNPSRLLE
jgi:protein-tyrosine phosphatase